MELTLTRQYFSVINQFLSFIPLAFSCCYKLEEVLSVSLKHIVLWQLYTTSASPNSAGHNSKVSYHS